MPTAQTLPLFADSFAEPQLLFRVRRAGLSADHGRAANASKGSSASAKIGAKTLTFTVGVRDGSLAGAKDIQGERGGVTISEETP